MVRNEQMPISERWDGWLGSLVEALEATATSEGLGRCAPVSCAKVRDAVLAHLSRPTGGGQFNRLPDPFSFPDMPTAYSPAICNLGRLRRSIPRNLASSCMM